MPSRSTPNGFRLAFDDHGAGPPILFLHGIFVSRAQWAPQIEPLSSSYRVITCDLRGHGESSRGDGEAYSIELLARDVVQLLDELGAGEVVCCGHSFGGLVAQELCLSHPDRIRGLILSETLFGVRSSPWALAQSSFFTLWMPRLVGPRTITRLMAIYFGSIAPGATPYIMEELEPHLADPEHQQEILRASLGFDCRSRLHEIACPTLIVVGAIPQIPLVMLHALEMRWRIQRAECEVIPRGGHMLNWDNPRAFNQAVDSFMQQVA